MIKIIKSPEPEQLSVERKKIMVAIDIQILLML